MADPGTVAQRLSEKLGFAVPEARRLSSGASRETWLLPQAGDPPRDLVAQLQRRRTSGVDEPALLAKAVEAGVPAPRVVGSGGKDDVLGNAWTVAEFIPGTVDPRAIQATDDPDALIDDLARVLALIHGIDVPGEGLPRIDDPLAMLRERHNRLEQPHPVFEMAFRRLEQTRPPKSEPRVVHGDYRLGNLLVDDNKVSGVLDWEIAHVGDPVHDLGWMCVRAWRFGRPDRPVAGLGARDRLLAAYADASGTTVDPAALRWWETYGTLAWGVICVEQAFAHLSGTIQSLEHAVIGRRAAEVEWDLLDLLEAQPSTVRNDTFGLADDTGSPHDRPDAGELLEAARQALGDDVLPHVDGRAKFQLRVAMRALGMVKREVELAAFHEVSRRNALEDLQAADEFDAAAYAREGKYDHTEESALHSMRRLVHVKLEAANPRHLDPIEGES